MPRNRVVAAPLILLALCSVAAAQDAPPVRANEPAKVTIEADRTPLLAVLKRLCSERSLNFVFDPRVLDRAGDVCLSLRDVSFDEAIDAMGDLFDLEIRLRGKIVTVRSRPEGATPRLIPVPPSRPTDGAKPAAKPSGSSVLPRADEVAKPQEPSRPEPARPDAVKPELAKGEAPRNDDAARPEAPRKPEGDKAAALAAMGVVVDLALDHVKLKERSGDPRDFYVPEARRDDLELRAARIAQTLKGLKKGDQVALTYELDAAGRAVISNIIGGPRRAAAPQQPIPGSN